MSFNVNGIPTTGDQNNTLMFVVIGVIVGLLILGLFIFLRVRSSKQEPTLSNINEQSPVDSSQESSPASSEEGDEAPSDVDSTTADSEKLSE